MTYLVLSLLLPWCVLSYVFMAWYYLHDPRLLPTMWACYRRWRWWPGRTILMGVFCLVVALAPLYWFLYLLFSMWQYSARRSQ